MNLTNLKRTCDACPSQWDGTFEDGERFYARYRWGSFTVDKNEVEIFRRQIGDELDGVMTTSEMLDIVREIGITYNERH